jgi:hypothetical protein
LRFIGFEASTVDELPTADSASSERRVEAPSV